MAAAAALHGLSCLSRAAAVEALRRVLHTTHNDAALFIVDAFGFVFGFFDPVRPPASSVSSVRQAQRHGIPHDPQLLQKGGLRGGC